MPTLRKLFSFAAASLTICMSAAAHAEVWTASFLGIAYGYDNLSPYAPQNPNFIRNASGSLIFDPAQIAFNGFFFSGPGVELNFKVGNRSFTYGGIGDDPDTQPEGGFSSGTTATRQQVGWGAGNGGCGLLCSAGLVLSGPVDAYGPSDLTPQTFHPGPTFLDGSSYLTFGTREIGATIFLTSIRFTPNGSVGAIPEPSTYVMMLAGLALLAGASRHCRRVAAIRP